MLPPWDTDMLKQMITSILVIIENLSQQALAYATSTNPKFLEFASIFSTYAIAPLASILFALFAMMQVYKAISTLNDIGAPQGGSARFETLGFLFVRLGFIYAAITLMSKFMWGLVAAGNWLMEKIHMTGTNGGAEGFESLQSRINFMADNTNAAQTTLQTMGSTLLLLLIYFLLLICSLIVFVLFYARILQILVMMAVAPIPIVTLIHEEHRQIGVSFIKSFCAVVLQGAVMILIIRLYNKIINYAMIEADSLIGMVWIATGYAVLLVVALAGSGALSKKILAAI